MNFEFLAICCYKLTLRLLIFSMSSQQQNCARKQVELKPCGKLTRKLRSVDAISNRPNKLAKHFCSVVENDKQKCANYLLHFRNSRTKDFTKHMKNFTVLHVVKISRFNGEFTNYILASNEASKYWTTPFKSLVKPLQNVCSSKLSCAASDKSEMLIVYFSNMSAVH